MILANSGLDLKRCDAYQQLEFLPFDPRKKRTEAKLKGPDGKVRYTPTSTVQECEAQVC